MVRTTKKSTLAAKDVTLTLDFNFSNKLGENIKVKCPVTIDSDESTDIVLCAVIPLIAEFPRKIENPEEGFIKMATAFLEYISTKQTVASYLDSRVKTLGIDFEVYEKK